MVVVAVDMGGSKIKAAIVSSNFTVDYSLEVPTNAFSGEKEVVRQLQETIGIVLSKTKKKVSAIGISMPGIIENDHFLFVGGTLNFLLKTPLKSILEKKFKLPIIIANDSDCFTLAESTFGAGKNYDKIFGIIWGSGIGSGLVLKTPQNTMIVSGSEIGHLNIHDDFKKKTLSVENCAGGLSVEKEYERLTGKKISMKEIYSSKDKIAKMLIDRMIKSIAKGISYAIQITNPEIVVLGGGVSNLPVLTRLKAEVKKNVMSLYAKKLNIKRFKISDDSGLYGAAILALAIK